MHINEIKELLQANEASALKKYGQNFLIDEHVLQTISASLKGTNTSVIEIGPGLGSLTRYLVKDYKEVLAYEIDPKMVNIIKGTIPNVNIIEGDFLKQDINKDISAYFTNAPCLISNLPYYITTPIIIKILEETPNINNFTLMMQKEVAGRILAKPDSKEYGSLSVLLQVYFEITKLIDVKPSAFYPAPDVSSTVLVFRRRSEPLYHIYNHERFKQIVQIMFTQRRKTLYNNLKNCFSKDLIDQTLNSLQINPTVRSEDLSIEQIVNICNLLS